MPISSSFSDDDAMLIVKHVLWTTPSEFLETQFEDALPIAIIRLRGLNRSHKPITMSFEVPKGVLMKAIRDSAPEDVRKEAAEAYRRLVMAAFAEEPNPSFLSVHRS